LGLASAPRVRFLERIEKKNVKKFTESEAENVMENTEQENGGGDKYNFKDDNDQSDEEIFSVKRADHKIEDNISEEMLFDKKDGKVITKAQAAKKLLKKKIGNSKIVFDDEGDIVLDVAKQKQSKEGQDYEQDEEDRLGGGIDISEAKEVLRAEDKFDKAAERARIKEKHKENKRKLKEENARRKAEKKGEEGDVSDEDDDEGSEPDLSWLPDPDKIYKEQKDEEDNSDEDGNSASNEDHTETVEVKDGKRSLTVIKSVIPAKRSRRESSSSSYDDDETLHTGLSLGEDEDLALKLLSH